MHTTTNDPNSAAAARPAGPGARRSDVGLQARPANVPAAATSLGAVLSLQRLAGNAAVSRGLGQGQVDKRDRPRLQRNPETVAMQRTPPASSTIAPPGTGWDGLVGEPFSRDLTAQMKEIVTEFRTMLEQTKKTDRGQWAQKAGLITASFSGTPHEKAVLYGELQRQMIQAHSNWAAAHNRGKDGSYIFIAKLKEMFFIVTVDGQCATGKLAALSGPSKARVVQQDSLRFLSGTPAAAPARSGGGMVGGTGTSTTPSSTSTSNKGSPPTTGTQGGPGTGTGPVRTPVRPGGGGGVGTAGAGALGGAVLTGVFFVSVPLIERWFANHLKDKWASSVAPRGSGTRSSRCPPMRQSLRVEDSAWEPFATGELEVGDGHVLYYEEVGNPDGCPSCTCTAARVQGARSVRGATSIRNAIGKCRA